MRSIQTTYLLRQELRSRKSYNHSLNRESPAWRNMPGILSPIGVGVVSASARGVRPFAEENGQSAYKRFGPLMPRPGLPCNELQPRHMTGSSTPTRPSTLDLTSPNREATFTGGI